VAPLVLLAEECAKRGEAVAFLNGARNAAELIAPEDLGAGAFAEGSLLLETTEDGSRGRTGRVLDALDDARVRAMAGVPGAAFYSCGPHGLLEAVGLAARARALPAWVALEAHMACGTGICRSCVIPRSPGASVPPEASNATFLLACLDGPCVAADTVDWKHAP
jgi:dihydroorotate dehydrogenase electron transfer subunit